MGKTLHIVGAGVAGLACAVAAIQAGHTVRVYEATKRAGGRCRSFYDATLGATLDNGSHVVLGGNPYVFKYLNIIGARDSLVPSSQTGEIPFVNSISDERWTIQPNPGPIPWWVLSAKRRPPHTCIGDFSAGLNLFRKFGDKSVAEILSEHNDAWLPFWQPVSLAIMNTQARDASAALFGAAIRYALFSGGGSFTPFVPTDTLAATFTQPAENYLRKAGCILTFESPLIGIEGEASAKSLHFRTHTVSLNDDDAVVLALPPWSPAVRPFQPRPFFPQPSPIVNAHYAFDGEAGMPRNRIIGVISGAGHWIVRRSSVVSVTVSADPALAQLNHEEIAALLWQDVQKGLDISGQQVPANRVIVERRATPVQDTTFNKNRPTTRTTHKNLYLAGDWINTGLPCTLESAIKSGFKAADAANETRSM